MHARGGGAKVTPFADSGGPRLGVIGWGILQILVTGALGFVFHDMQAKEDRIRALEIGAGAKNAWTLTDQRGFERDVQAKLGQQLRATFDDIVSQGVPDRFAELLNRLDEGSKKDKP